MKDFIFKNYIHIWHVVKFVSFSCGKYKFRYKTKLKRKTLLLGWVLRGCSIASDAQRTFRSPRVGAFNDTKITQFD
jgi:hypothetical protein